jgi:iron-sulfur cluster repair protein YtfE (RIC family)
MGAGGAPAGPLAAMRDEHEDIEGTLARVSEVGAPGEAADLLLHLVEVARAHFLKEEQVLFPMAEETLAEATLLELGERWAERRLGPRADPA